ncbi:SDR family NAD(P)-dependent oxidoreductase [Streptomyces sp. NPDC050560]|uniref:SDR family NAD(P)-dependent oxidoreductase n=1 Tax=Streptomyces sp. NPDC050560 TaxID=3365630 RepID=UPI0037AF449E
MAPSHTPAPLQGLTSVVTGGSRGLGLLMADRLAARGSTVTLAARDPDELDRAADLLRARGRHGIRTAVCDVADRAAVRDMMRTAAHGRGGIDTVLACAGIIQVAPVRDIGAAEFERAMDGIFRGALHTSLEALPYLRESPAGGRLGLIGSVGGIVAPPHLLPYACAKSAVGALAEGLHAELAKDGVSVTAVHPGLMRTGSHLQAEFGGDAGREFGWFSALAGAPLVSMDAARAAERIVAAVERRRTRIVLTPAAKAAAVLHGIAPAATTRLTAVADRLLPAPTGTAGGLRKGRDTPPPAHPVAARLRAWGSALGDRAATAYNERPAAPRPQHR